MGLTKTWVTGPNPRKEHAELDGETVPIGSEFSNGFQAPPAGKNCNCSIVIEGKAKPRYATTDEAADHITEVMHEAGNTVPFPVHLDWQTASGVTKKIPVEVANELAVSIDNIAKDMPDVLGKVTSIAVSDGPIEQYAWVTSRYPGTINLNAKWFGKKLDRLQESLANDFVTGFAVTPDVEGALIHEMAHVLFGTSGSFGNALDLLVESGFTIEEYNTASTLISGYAAANKAEFMAELFAAATRSYKRLDEGFIKAFRDALIKKGLLRV